MAPTESDNPIQYPVNFFNQSRRGSQQSNISDSSPTSSRWKGFPLPSWGRRSQQSKSSGASEDEILAAMKEANLEQQRNAPMEEEGETSGYGDKETDINHPWHCRNDERADYESIDLNLENIESPFQLTSYYRGATNNNRSSARNSRHHQQQDSVSSMQQYYHNPSHSFDEQGSTSHRYYSSDFRVDQQEQYYEHRSHNPHPLEQVNTLSTVMEVSDSNSENSTHFMGASDNQTYPATPSNEQNDHTKNYDSSHKMPIINKAIAKLTNQPHHSHSDSNASNSSTCSNDSSPTVISHSRSATGIGQLSSAMGTPRRQSHSPGSTYPSTAIATPSPSSPSVTLNCSRHDSLSSTMILKLKALENLEISKAKICPERDFRDQNMYDISINQSESTIHERNILDGALLPSPASCISKSTTNTTLVTSSLATLTRGDSSQTLDIVSLENDDDHSEPLVSCLFPDWETFKSGILPTSKRSREVLLATVILVFVTIALEAILLQRHRAVTVSLTEGPKPYEISYFRPLMVYYTIFILAEVFAVGLLWDAAIHKNSLQLVAFTVFEWCIVSYSGLQICQHDNLFKEIGVPIDDLMELGDSNTRTILFAQLGVQIAASLGITLLTWRLYSEFGWLVFQKLGADVSLRKMMKEYRLLFTLLKLDAFFFFGYALQVAALTDKQWQKGLVEVAFAIPLSAIIILLGFWALRNENKVIMGGFIACLALLIGYMAYRLAALHQTMTGDPATDPYFLSRKTMTVFASLTLIMTILALINAIVMLYNFNKGLKEAMEQYRVKRTGTIRSVTRSVHRISANGSLSNLGGDASAPGTPRIRPAAGGVGGRFVKRTSKRDSTPVMAERWQIE
ncbi:hypothetical protein BGZ76_008138 [Entomortierella beljakovae]|nr:hypothetical protein BGZ76_008138 [Entomortierella beljakovae]